MIYCFDYISNHAILNLYELKNKITQPSILTDIVESNANETSNFFRNIKHNFRVNINATAYPTIRIGISRPKFIA